MARSLYREWFVHFRFPGHENHPLVPSAFGRDSTRLGSTKPVGDCVAVNSRVAVPRVGERTVHCHELHGQTTLCWFLTSRFGRGNSGRIPWVTTLLREDHALPRTRHNRFRFRAPQGQPGGYLDDGVHSAARTVPFLLNTLIVSHVVRPSVRAIKSMRVPLADREYRRNFATVHLAEPPRSLSEQF